jgi:hypothetical protein
LKKIIAYALLFVYLYNIAGALVSHYYFSYLADKYFAEQAAKGFYNTNDLTEVKLPNNMPGIAEWPCYENISGQIKFADETYNYVKMRITRTAIYLMCIPDYGAGVFSNQNIINAMQVKHMPVPKKEHVPFAKLSLINTLSLAVARFEFIPFSRKLRPSIIPLSCGLISNYPDIPKQPPKFYC